MTNGCGSNAGELNYLQGQATWWTRAPGIDPIPNKCLMLNLSSLKVVVFEPRKKHRRKHQTVRKRHRPFYIRAEDIGPTKQEPTRNSSAESEDEALEKKRTNRPCCVRFLGKKLDF